MDFVLVCASQIATVDNRNTIWENETPMWQHGAVLHVTARTVAPVHANGSIGSVLTNLYALRKIIRFR